MKTKSKKKYAIRYLLNKPYFLLNSSYIKKLKKITKKVLVLKIKSFFYSIYIKEFMIA